METAVQDTTEITIPRPLLKVGVPCVGVLLIFFFFLRGFPYDQLAERITTNLEQGSGVQLMIGELDTAKISGHKLRRATTVVVTKYGRAVV